MLYHKFQVGNIKIVLLLMNVYYSVCRMFLCPVNIRKNATSVIVGVVFHFKLKFGSEERLCSFY